MASKPTFLWQAMRLVSRHLFIVARAAARLPIHIFIVIYAALTLPSRFSVTSFFLLCCSAFFNIFYLTRIVLKSNIVLAVRSKEMLKLNCKQDFNLTFLNNISRSCRSLFLRRIDFFNKSNKN